MPQPAARSAANTRETPVATDASRFSRKPALGDTHNGRPQGVEVDLVREFAAQLGTTPEWRWGGAQQQMEALEDYRMDLVIGGFASRTPWKNYVGLTSPYFTDGTTKHVMATAPGENGFIKCRRSDLEVLSPHSPGC